MPILEAQLETWSHLGSKIQSASTYQALERLLRDPRAPYSDRRFDIFLQGSYGNDTNIRGDSDVDIVICLTSTVFEDATSLDPPSQARLAGDFVQATYLASDFKRDVARWLAANLGDGVDASGKAIAVPGNSTRRNADVLACIELRSHRSYSGPYLLDVDQGITFWNRDGTRIENFPRQHAAECTRLHQATGGRFKPAVRILKNLRNAMVARGDIAAGSSPSYFVEGMASNVPTALFDGGRQTCLANIVDWLWTADLDGLTCANRMHWLLRDGLPVCWNRGAFVNFLAGVRRYWRET